MEKDFCPTNESLLGSMCKSTVGISNVRWNLSVGFIEFSE